MKRTTEDDAIDWFGAVRASAAVIRELQEKHDALPVTTCRCGAVEELGRETQPIADLCRHDVDAIAADALRRCRTCPHAIHKGQRCFRYTPPRSGYSDYYHPECAVI